VNGAIQLAVVTKRAVVTISGEALLGNSFYLMVFTVPSLIGFHEALSTRLATLASRLNGFRLFQSGRFKLVNLRFALLIRSLVLLFLPRVV